MFCFQSVLEKHHLKSLLQMHRERRICVLCLIVFIFHLSFHLFSMSSNEYSGLRAALITISYCFSAQSCICVLWFVRQT